MFHIYIVNINSNSNVKNNPIWKQNEEKEQIESKFLLYETNNGVHCVNSFIYNKFGLNHDYPLTWSKKKTINGNTVHICLQYKNTKDATIIMNKYKNNNKINLQYININHIYEFTQSKFNNYNCDNKIIKKTKLCIIINYEPKLKSIQTQITNGDSNNHNNKQFNSNPITIKPQPVSEQNKKPSYSSILKNESIQQINFWKNNQYTKSDFIKLYLNHNNNNKKSCQVIESHYFSPDLQNNQNIRLIIKYLQCLPKYIEQHYDYLMYCMNHLNSFQQVIKSHFLQEESDEFLNIILMIVNKTLHQRNEFKWINNQLTINSYYHRKSQCIPIRNQNWRLYHNSCYTKSADFPICVCCDWIIREHRWGGLACSKCNLWFHYYCAPKVLIKYMIPKYNSTDYKDKEYKYNHESFICPLHKPYLINYINSTEKVNALHYQYLQTIFIDTDNLLKINKEIKEFIKPGVKQTKYYLLQHKQNQTKFTLLTFNQLHQTHKIRRKIRLLFSPSNLNHDQWKQIKIKCTTSYNKSLKTVKKIKKHIIEYYKKQPDKDIDTIIGFTDDGDYNPKTSNVSAAVNEVSWWGNHNEFGAKTYAGWFSLNEYKSIAWIACSLLCDDFNLMLGIFNKFKIIDKTSRYFNHVSYIRNRVKNYMGGGIYVHPTLGATKYVTTGGASHFYGKQLFNLNCNKKTNGKWKYLNSRKPILCALPLIKCKNHYYPKVIHWLIQFLNQRYQAWTGQKLHLKQIQNNLYSQSGYIYHHFDFYGWFIKVFLCKILNHSSLHFGLCDAFGGYVINHTYLFPLLTGEWFEFDSYAATHYKHSLASWMHRKEGITLLARELNKQAQYHHYPQFEYSGKITDKQYEELLYQEPKVHQQQNVKKFWTKNFNESMDDYKPFECLQ